MSIILAKTYGIYFIFVGLGLFFSPSRFRDWYKAILNEDRRQLLGALFSLLIGALIIAVHNIWASDWRLIITLIGYWGVFSGAGCFLSRNFFSYFRPMIDSSDLIYKLSGIIWALLGLFLASQGYSFF